MNAANHKARRALRATMLSERGSAIIVTIGILFVIMSVAAVAAGASILSQQGTTRDKTVKGALAIADAGANAAVWRQNQVLTTDTLPCLIETVSGELVPGAAASDGWCPAITDEVGNGSFTYRVMPPITLEAENLLQTRVVSTGTAGAETRRVMTLIEAPLSTPLFNGYGVTSLDDLVVDGNGTIGSSTEPTSSASNSNVTLSGSALDCGNITHGVTGSLTTSGSASQCSGYTVSTATTTLSPVDQGTVRTNNDNGRFVGVFPLPPLDPHTGGGSSFSWVGGTGAGSRKLTMQGSSTLTLGGSNYSLCELNLSGSSQLIVSAAATATLWFDSPEDCGQPAGYTQLNVTGTARFVNTSTNSTQMRLYFLGSDQLSTNINLTGNSSINQWLVLHAPRSTLNLNGNTTVRGAIAAKQVTIGGSAKIIWEDEVDSIEDDLIPLYQRERYIECRGDSVTTPDANC